MTVRIFSGADGVPWQVWAVQPPSPDRRSGEERRADDASDPWHERRRGQDRRVRDVGRPGAIAGPLSRGWLCFEAVGPEEGAARRRLAPIPADWEECGEATLCALLEQAAPVVRRTRSA